MKIKGKLTEWNDDRGFGFIESMTDAQRFFVHISAFPKGRRPQLDDVVMFQSSQDAKGRLNALSIQYASTPKRPKHRPSIVAPRSLLATLHLLLVASLTVLGKLPVWWFAGVLLMSVATFLVYRQDKKAAQAGQWRTPENTLQMMALIGGWSGALWAQLFLRHKSQKTEFLVVFWLMVLINLAATFYVAFKGVPVLA